MKKTLFAFACVATLVFAGCGNKTNTPAAANDSAANDSASYVEAAKNVKLSAETQSTYDALVAQVNNAISKKDPKAATTALADLEATYKALVNAGKLDEAKAYGTAIKGFISEHANELTTLASNAATGNTTIADLVSGIKNLPTSAETTAEQAKNAVAEDVVGLASPYIQKGAAAAATAQEAAEAVKNAPATVKNVAETAAKQAVNNAEQQAVSKANEAVSGAQEKVNKKVEEGQQKAAKKVEEGQKKANDAVNKAAGKALKGLGL